MLRFTHRIRRLLAPLLVMALGVVASSSTTLASAETQPAPETGVVVDAPVVEPAYLFAYIALAYVVGFVVVALDEQGRCGLWEDVAGVSDDVFDF